MSRLTSFTALSLTLGLAVAAHTAHAGTTTTIGAGVDCAQAYSEEGNTTYNPDSGIYSWAPSWWRTVVCPIRQQTPYVLNSSANVDVIDQSYDLDVTCKIVVHRGGWTAWGAARTSTGSSPNQQRISIAFENGAHQIGREVVLCYLPPVYGGNRSGLLAYDAAHTTWL